MQLSSNQGAIILKLCEPQRKGLEGGRGRGTAPGYITLKPKSTGFTQTTSPVSSGTGFRNSLPISSRLSVSGSHSRRQPSEATASAGAASARKRRSLVSVHRSCFCPPGYKLYNQSAHRGVIRVYVSMGDRRGNDSPEERGEEEERRKS